jgi:rubrerythrin
MNTTPRPTVDELLNLALQKEETARDFYAKLAQGCQIDFVRELLEQLANEEEKHVHMIRNMQARLHVGKKPA